MDPTPRLACEQCKRRKLRCDKKVPCTTCATANLNCRTVQRARLPRGKAAKARRDKGSLESRIAKIESLLEQQSKRHLPSPCHSEQEVYVGTQSSRIQGFVAPDFWNSLSGEIYGLREALEESDDEVEAELSMDHEVQQDSQMHETGPILFGDPNKKVGFPLLVPSVDQRKRMLKLYRYRVDSVYKVFHWPTVFSSIETGANTSSSFQALENAIYFMALCSITDCEADELELGSRPEMLRRYRSTVERLLAESSLLRKPDITILQAFVIYLIGLRTCSSGASTWTLVAIAVRVAAALRLGDEPSDQFAPLEVEIRRRLLYTIGLLDTHSALDRGTIPLLPSSAFKVPPLNINDDDLKPTHSVPASPSSESTDMSHMLMTCDAMICQRKLYELSVSDNGWEQWDAKMEQMNLFEKSIRFRANSNSNSNEPLEQLKRMSAEKIIVSMHLLLRRPPYRQPHNIVPPWDDLDILESATKVLEAHMQPMPNDLQPWAWKNWVQWHALAVVLAELMARPGHTLSDRAYAVATKSFRHYANIVADSESGMLWRPIVKLMRRVQRSRNIAQAETKPEAIMVQSACSNFSDNMTEKLDLSVFDDLEPFDLNDWNLETEVPATYLVTEEMGNSVIEDSREGCMPWLAWDHFLEDIQQLP